MILRCIFLVYTMLLPSLSASLSACQTPDVTACRHASHAIMLHITCERGPLQPLTAK